MFQCSRRYSETLPKCGTQISMMVFKRYLALQRKPKRSRTFKRSWHSQFMTSSCISSLIWLVCAISFPSSGTCAWTLLPLRARSAALNHPLCCAHSPALLRSFARFCVYGNAKKWYFCLGISWLMVPCTKYQPILLSSFQDDSAM